jgi:Fe-S-cluster containining protein
MTDALKPPFQSPVIPILYEGDHQFNFRCYKGISCWNACCSNIDITLTPYDILRLKQRLGISSAEFLRQYTVPYELEKDGLAGVKFKPVEGGTACQFMTDEGCSVYEDRPTACRYYPVGLLSMRRQDEYVDRNAYALVKEPHCLGHEEPRPITIDEFRREQGVEEYDEHARGWRQLVLKKKSSGPSIGALSLRSRQFYFMACYDLDTFRAFVTSDGFRESYDLSDAEFDELDRDDLALLHFSSRLLRQVLFGEVSIPMRREAVESRTKASGAAQAPQAESAPVVSPSDLNEAERYDARGDIY